MTFADEPAPMVELTLAIVALQRPDPLFALWRRQMLHALPRSAEPLLELVPATAKGPLFLDPLSQGFDDGLDQVLLADHGREAGQILEHSVRAAHAGGLLLGSWERIRAGFDSERAWRVQLLAGQGIRAMLAGLVQGAFPVYPAVTPLPLLDDPTANAQARLLGRTRAAILERLTRPRTTTDLPRQFGLTKSSVSEHTTALRAAHLTTAHRDGKTVWHTCTPLGLGLSR
ncbi:ArsR/SmtB family transcription factor [Streptomyces sp. NPDC059517]|uniref:ArsR/SmtB family transcription factor n=1 Tax=Streptomyces sp. NPDC059517 TaxID=3346855 RepID=UPI0036B9A9B6